AAIVRRWLQPRGVDHTVPLRAEPVGRTRVMTSSSIEQKLSALRQNFDQSFARAAGGAQPSQLDFLAIVVAGDAYAIRLSEVQSLHADRKLVAAPSVLPELLGVCGFRGVLMPVYDLARLLGYGPGQAARW